MKRYFALLAILLVVLFSFPVSSSAQPTDQVRFLQNVETGKHVTHHLPRATNLGEFTSLEEWIKANYTFALMTETLTHTFQDGRDAISFFTVSPDGITEHNILWDTGAEFVLRTTSTVKPPERNEINTDDDNQATDASNGRLLPMATSAASSCATGSTWNSTLNPPGWEPNAWNCTSYVRCLIPNYPRPALYYTEKLATRNVSYPSIGWVAIINTGSLYGHVAVIDNMWWVWQGYIANLYLSLNEANWTWHTVTYNRSGTVPQLRIVGYFRP